MNRDLPMKGALHLSLVTATTLIVLNEVVWRPAWPGVWTDLVSPALGTFASVPAFAIVFELGLRLVGRFRGPSAGALLWGVTVAGTLLVFLVGLGTLSPAHLLAMPFLGFGFEVGRRRLESRFQGDIILAPPSRPPLPHVPTSPEPREQAWA